ncbi:hypothetical protein Tco_1290460, partial [Tanacetum coccineum]
MEIDNLKTRVKKLENKQRSRTYKLRRLYKVGLSVRVISSEDEGLGEEDASKQGRKIHNIDVDEDITLEVADKDVNLSVDEVTLAQALAALKSAKVQEKRDVIKELSVPVSVASTKQEQEQDPTPIVSSQQPTQVKDKGKGKMVEEEPVKKISKKELLKLDEELAFKLQAEEEEQARLAREKAEKIKEANISWDNMQ